MISELKDDEILDFLMTSDFEGEYKPGEFKYLLLKWRHFYRILHSCQKYNLDDRDHTIDQLKNEIENLKKIISNKEMELANTQDRLYAILNRKLTIMERLSGKITTKQ